MCKVWSFRGATEGGEPGIHNPRPVAMDSGLAAEPVIGPAEGRTLWRRPGMTQHMIRISLNERREEI